MAPVKKILASTEVRYVLSSIKERLAAMLLADYLKLDVADVTSIDEYESYDVVFSQSSNTFPAEIKVRKKYIDSYQDWIYEETKHKELMSFVGTGVHPRFIVICFDGVLVWDVNKLDKKITFNEELLGATADSNYRKNKSVARLSIEDAKIIKYGDEFKIDYDKLKAQAEKMFYELYPNNTIPKEY